MLSDEELRALPAEERACLIRQLNELADAEFSTSPSRSAEEARHRFLTLMTVSAVVMIPWIVFLAITLPHRYVTSRWGATWVGFDIALLSSLASTAWFAWSRYQAVVVTSVIASTLLVADAWFDIMSASSGTDLAISIATAVLVELPLAVLLFSVGYRLLRVASHRARALPADAGSDRPLWNAPLLGVPPRPKSGLSSVEP